MKVYPYIWFLLLLFFSVTAYGQKKMEKQKGQSRYELLDLAEGLQEKSPARAIKLLEQVVYEARREKDTQVEGEAYILLGNIYDGIGQQKLALQRYQQAARILGNTKKGNAPATVFQRMGQSHIELGNDKEAEQNFRRCLE